MKDKLHYYTLGSDRFVKAMPREDVNRILGLRYISERKRLVATLLANELSVDFRLHGQSAYEGVNIFWKAWHIPFRLVTEPRHAPYKDPNKMIRVQTQEDWERSRRMGIKSVLLETPMGLIPAKMPVYNF